MPCIGCDTHTGRAVSLLTAHTVCSPRSKHDCWPMLMLDPFQLQQSAMPCALLLSRCCLAVHHNDAPTFLKEMASQQMIASPHIEFQPEFLDLVYG